MKKEQSKKPYKTDEEIAISVKGVSKTFRIPHEKVTSLRGAAVSIFKDRSYEEFKALDDVSFDVKKGEFFGIIGRNGSGKSTLLKVLAGIYKPDKVHPVKSAKDGVKQFHRGTVKIKGMISPFLELGIGFNPELSGRDNVYLNATVLGMTKKQIDEKFDSIVKFSELERFIDQKLKNYSSGMQVRLAFAVSIHANRDILLMDEVLAVGDSNFQSKCLEEFNKYREMGRTVIIVTHDISVVQRYCDRAMLLRNGKIVKIGQAREVSDEYVYENMDDEEDRSFLNNDEKNGEEKIEEQKDIRITFGKTMDNQGKQKKVFQTGDDIKLAVYFFVKDHIKDLIFRVSIESIDGIYLFGSDTLSCEYEIKNRRGENILLFHIKSNPFLRGEYAFNISCFKKNTMIPLEFKPRCAKFKVFSLANEVGYKGMVKIDHEWSE